MSSEYLENRHDKRIKVLQFGSPEELYGAERWILTLIKYLDASKFESCVVSIRDEPSLKALLCVEAEKLGFLTKIFNCYGKLSISAVRQLRRFILENDINIIHTHHYKTDIIGLLATIGISCKIISTPHGWTKQPNLKLWIYEIFDRLFFPFFDAVAPLSEGIYVPLSRIPGLNKKLHLIRNGVDTGEIEGTDHIADEIMSLKANGAFVIGYIGRLIPGKGIDVLLKAVAEYAEPQWQVVIIGEGEQYSELKLMVEALKIEEKVGFYGFRPDRLSFLKGFDVFVLPSRSEGTPRCLMEAMLAGIPVVASNIPGCRNLVDGKTTGLLFESDSHQELASAIKKISSDIGLRECLRLNGKEFIHSNFSSARMAQEYECLFLNMLSADLKVFKTRK